MYIYIYIYILSNSPFSNLSFLSFLIHSNFLSPCGKSCFSEENIKANNESVKSFFIHSSQCVFACIFLFCFFVFCILFFAFCILFLYFVFCFLLFVFWFLLFYKMTDCQRQHRRHHLLSFFIGQMIMFFLIHFRSASSDWFWFYCSFLFVCLFVCSTFNHTFRFLIVF